jgi:hypothetical protein
MYLYLGPIQRTNAINAFISPGFRTFPMPHVQTVNRPSRASKMNSLLNCYNVILNGSCELTWTLRLAPLGILPAMPTPGKRVFLLARRTVIKASLLQRQSQRKQTDLAVGGDVVCVCVCKNGTVGHCVCVHGQGHTLGSKHSKRDG